MNLSRNIYLYSINTISKEKRVVGVIVMLPLKNGNKKKRTIRRLAESVMLKILSKFRSNGLDENSSSSTIYTDENSSSSTIYTDEDSS
ncbi:unnamed protein product [Rhizophagus irregularis]|nr:unnamed protein product [Rhizophagus irregularis]